jgi:hypothetical protein
MDASTLAGLPPLAASRYKAFITAAYPPEALAAHLGDSLPSPPLIDAGARERLLLALSASAKVFAVGLVEEAAALRAGDGGVGSLAGYLSEAWRRRMLAGGLCSGRAREAAGAVRDAALRELTAAAGHAHSHAAAAAQAGGAKKKAAKAAVKKKAKLRAA